MKKLFDMVLTAPAPVWGVFMAACGYGVAFVASHPEYYVPAVFYM